MGRLSEEKKKKLLEKLQGYFDRMPMTKAKLAARTEFTTNQFDKWLAGITRVPFEAIDPLSREWALGIKERLELYSLAGFTIPEWLVPQETAARHGGMKKEECKVIDLGSVENMYRYVTQKLETASSVCDLTWGSGIPFRTPVEEQEHGEYLAAVHRACERNVSYYEVISFYKPHPYYIERAKDILKANQKTYHLRYYELSLDQRQRPPLMSYIIIDKQIVIAGLYNERNRIGDAEVHIAIENSLTCDLFQDYYAVIWENASTLKDGDTIDWDALRQLKAHYPGEVEG